MDKIVFWTPVGIAELICPHCNRTLDECICRE